MNTLVLSRLTDPAVPLATECPESLANGTQPNNRHTYDGIEYLPKVDKMFVFGGSLATCGYGSLGTWFPPETFRLAIVLLYTTGLRRGELVRLQIGDYRQEARTLLIRESKFHKSRWAPLSGDAAEEIDKYLRLRYNHKLPSPADAPLLWNGQRGFRSYTDGGFARKLHHILEGSGIRKPDGRVPRIHDFRWTFAVHALLRWYRSGADVQAKLPFLATYMGTYPLHQPTTTCHSWNPYRQRRVPASRFGAGISFVRLKTTRRADEKSFA